MSIDYRAVTDEFASMAQRTGLFDAVNRHEPKNVPGRGITCSVFYAGKRPTQRSGLASTSVVARWVIQVECSMLREPQDEIDTDLCEAADAIWAALHGGFTLDVAGVRHVDLLGSEGDAVADEAGYVTRAEKQIFRVIGITVPVVFNDAFEQGE